MIKTRLKRLAGSRTRRDIAWGALIVLGAISVIGFMSVPATLGMSPEHRRAVSDVNEAADTVRAELGEHLQRFGISIEDANPLCYSNDPFEGGSCYEQAYTTELPMDHKVASTFAVESQRLSTVLPAMGWTAEVSNASFDVSAHYDDAAVWLETSMLYLEYTKQVNGLACDLDLTAGTIGSGTLHGFIYCTKPVDPAGLPKFPG